ncbi:MAG TPA: FxLYD domain-containing protein [Candidatus Polarisedimenticolia bacterium]|nr:FxLYD domain-containing protein [Candidatus Polarisedimenticolia bacterium]
MTVRSNHPLPSRLVARAARALTLLVCLALAASGLAVAESNSARYKFEGNKWLSLDLAVGDVRLDTIKFEWPATLMRVKTGYKATVKVVNGSSRQAPIGIAVVLYDAEGKLVGAGTTGTSIGTVDPGDSAQFSVDFNHVTERLEQASQFHIVLETR